MTTRTIHAKADSLEEAKAAQAEFDRLRSLITHEDIDAEPEIGEFYTVVPHDGSEPFHLNVAESRRLLKSDEPHGFTTMDVPLSDTLVRHLITDGGIEQAGVEDVPEDFEWDEPALAFAWSQDEKSISLQLFDGAHRVIRAAMRGDKTFPAAICTMEWARENIECKFKNPNISAFMSLITKHNFEWRNLRAEIQETENA